MSGRTRLAPFLAALLATAPLLAAAAPAAAFSPAAGWSGAVLLPQAADGDIGDAHFVRTSAGGLAAGWATDHIGVYDALTVSTFDANDGWPYPRTLTTVAGASTGMRVAYDEAADGSAVAAWEYIYSPSAPRIIQARVRSTDGAWGPETTVNSSVTGYLPRVAALGGGNFLAFWSATNVSASWMASSLYSSGSWGPATTVLPPSLLTFAAYDLQPDGTGGAFAVWAQGNVSEATAYASHFTVTGGWSTPVDLETSGSLGDYKLAADRQGGASVAWSYSDVAGLHVRATRYDPGGGWLANTTVGAPLTAAFIGLAAAPGPKAALVWWDYDWANDTRSLGGATWDGSSWSTLPSPPAAVSTDGLAGIWVALRTDGSGLAAFSVSDNEFVQHLFAAPFDATGWGQVAEVHEGGMLSPLQVFAWDDGGATIAGTLNEGGAASLAAFTYRVPDTTPPALSVNAPAPGSATDDPNVVVEGTTEPGASVWVNGAAVEVDGNGGFSVVVALSPGENTIYVSTADAAGNRDEVGVAVTYDDPTAGLAAQLDATRADLEAANATLASLAADNTQAEAALKSATADLAEAQARIVLLEAQQNQTANTLRSATDDNAALAGQVATLSLVAFAALIAGISAIGLAMVMSGRASRDVTAPDKGASERRED